MEKKKKKEIDDKYGINIKDIKIIPSIIKNHLIKWFKSHNLPPRLWVPQEIAITGWFCPKCGIPGRSPKPEVCPNPECKNSELIDLDLLNPETKHFVLGLTTASGKTLLAILKALMTIYDYNMERTGRKVLYLVPLKALATEKLKSFNKQWGKDSTWEDKYKIKVYYLKSITETGEIDIDQYNREKEIIKNGDLFIITYEKADIYIRNRSSLLDNVGLVIIDEGHIIGEESRGPIVEMITTRLKMQYPSISILYLSATISNIREIADWLENTTTTNIRGKFLGMIWNKSENKLEVWRPVKLFKGICVDNPFKINNDKYHIIYYYYNKQITTEKIKALENNVISNLVLDALINRDPPEQVLIICNTRHDTENIAKRIARVLYKYSNDIFEEYEKNILKIIANYFFISEGLAVSRIEYNPNSKEIDNLYRFFLEGVAFHHAGLCLTKDSLIQLADGSIYKIKELYDMKKNNQYVISLDTTDMKLKPKKILKVLKILSPKNLIKIITEFNKEIIVTSNHPLLTNNNNKILWKNADLLKIGDIIATASNIKTYPECNPLFANVININNIITLQYNNDNIRIPDHISPRFLKLVGLVTANGKIIDNKLLFTNSNIELIKEFKDILYTEFKIKSTVELIKNIEKTKEFIIYSESEFIIKILTEYFKLNNNINNFDIAQTILKLPNKHIASYIQGLFDCNLIINNNNNSLEYHYNNKIFGQKLQLLLLRFGITSIINKNIKNKNYKILINGINNIKKFYNKIGLNNSIKVSKLNNVINISNNNNINNGNLDNDINWEKIKKIEIIPSNDKYLYDLTIDGTKNFIADGFIAHNSDKLRQLIEMSYTGEILYRLFDDNRELFNKLGLNKYIQKRDDIRNIKLLRIIVATTTLAAGVNLPSGLVILHSVNRFSPTWKTQVKLTTREVTQIFGRAGRPGIEYGRALLIYRTPETRKEISQDIITNSFLWKKYITGNIEDIVSKLIFINDFKILNKFFNKGIISAAEEVYYYISYKEISQKDVSFNSLSLIKQLLGSFYMYNEIPLYKISLILWNTFYWNQNYNRSIKLYEALKEFNRPQLTEDELRIKEDIKEQQKIFDFLNKKLIEKTEKAIEFLIYYKMIFQKESETEEEEEIYQISDFGTKVARLYIDPIFAGYSESAIKFFNSIGPNDLKFLHLLSLDESIQPPFIKEKDRKRIEFIVSTTIFYINIPDKEKNFTEYERFLKAYSSAEILLDWINEFPIQFIIDKYDIYESDLIRKQSAARRLAILFVKLFPEIDYPSYCYEMFYRISYGVRKELIKLVLIKQIGRVRARKLFSAGFFTPLYIYFSFVKIESKKIGRRKIAEEILVPNINIKKDLEKIENDEELFINKRNFGIKIYKAIEKLVSENHKCPTKDQILEMVYNKKIIKKSTSKKSVSYYTSKKITDKQRLVFDRIFKKIIEKGYVREIKVPILIAITKKGSKVPYKYEWNKITRYVPFNDALVLNSILKPKIALKIYKNIYENIYFKDLIKDIETLIINAAKLLKSKKIEINSENIYNEIVNFLSKKEIEIKNIVYYFDIDELKFIITHRIRLFKEKLEKIEAKKEEKPRISIYKTLGVDLEIIDIINNYEAEAISRGLTSREDILPTFEDIVNIYLEKHPDISEEEATKIINNRLIFLLKSQVRQVKTEDGNIRYEVFFQKNMS